MQFDDKFFQQIGLEDAPEEQKAEMLAKLSELVQGRVAMKLADHLNEEQLQHFDSLLEAGKDEEASGYLQQIYPEYPQLLQAEVDAVKQLFAGDVSQVMSDLDNTN